MLAGYEVENPPAKKQRISNVSGNNISNRTMNDPVIEDDGMEKYYNKLKWMIPKCLIKLMEFALTPESEL